MSDPSSPPASDAAPDPAPKKGLSPLAWIGIGCGGLVLVGIIAMVVLGVSLFNWGREALEDVSGEESLSDLVESLEDNPVRTLAETAIRMNPEFELLGTDDAAGTITFRNTETGEEATLNFEDIAEGRFTMTTAEGEVAVEATEESSDGAGGVTFTGGPDGQTRLGASVDLGDLPEWVPVYPGSSDVQLPYATSTPEGQSGMLSGRRSTRFSKSETSTKVSWKPMASPLATSPAHRAGRTTFDRSRRQVTTAPSISR